MKITGKEIVAYTPGDTNIQTLLGSNNKGIYFGQSRYQIRKKHPCITFITLDDATSQIRQAEETAFCSMPRPITEESFENALYELPPGDYCHIDGVEAFHCIEMYTSDIASIYFQYDGKYYACSNRIDRKKELVDYLLKTFH